MGFLISLSYFKSNFIDRSFFSFILKTQITSIPFFSCFVDYIYFILFNTFTFACEFLLLDPQSTWPHVHEPELLLHGRALL